VSPKGRPRSSDDTPGGGRRRRTRRRGQKRQRRVLVIALVLTAIAVPAIVAAVGFTAAEALANSCTLSSLRPVGIGQNSFVYAADGTLLGSIPAERNRQPVSLRRINPWLRKGAVAIEDRRFYQHGGVDYQAILRALWKDLTAGKVVEGGSTITQQLVRNLYISQERTFQRKIKEACLAIKLSQHWTKNRILTEWMNQVYFGNHAYGVEAAAETYFSRHASELNLPQAALLAGLPQAPSLFDPLNHPFQARVRRDEVLRAMLDNGDITRAQYRWAVGQRKLNLKPGRLYTTIREPYFFSFVRDQLIAEYGANTVRSGGLRVYTTIDPAFQRAAQQAIRDTLNLKTDPAAALVAINPANGAIRAMTSVTPGGGKSQFNLAAQARRQAGSTFKTFVLAEAIAQGIDPESTYYVSAPFHYQPNPRYPAWDVSTYDHTYAGSISIEKATLRSDNTVYAKLTLDVGPGNVAHMAKKLGVQTPLLPVPSIGLGSIAVSPLDMASAYATIAAGGIYSKPMAIRKVVLANGRVDTDAGWGKPDQTRVIPDGVAYEVTKILHENVLYGTGVAANFGKPAAGKTGTTDNHADAWFCGYTPNLEASVWVGYPRAEIPMENVHGIAVAGGTFPAQIWNRFMSRALRYSPSVDFPLPKHQPVWKPFHQGHYGSDYIPVVQAPTTVSQPTAIGPPVTFVNPNLGPKPVPVPQAPPAAPPPPPAPPAQPTQTIVVTPPPPAVAPPPPPTPTVEPPPPAPPPPPATTDAPPPTDPGATP
jgi:penicillin-binding protein 1A